ncbi:TrmH family RNA methyltransferase [Candidatus Chlamydia sanziniae]|uniref:Methyltransferase n=1 Tax=Candidatus Chlamydia sanziniae TaxID=1806891 RepID=A0A1A9HU04_9CHLA|nr:RNA methyltransferase [Candidatus Chlamydia sanziniae]ANH78325.1 methyltransferase [Candidatus Chlamydia sanziniae]
MEFVGKHNPKIKEALALKRSRSRKGALFLVEGIREIEKALLANYECLHIFCGSKIPQREDFFFQNLQNSSIELLFCLEETLSQLSYKEHCGNFIAVMKKKWWSQGAFLKKQSNPEPFYLIIEQVEKPGNVGAVLRIADSAGADGVILCDPKVNLYNPNILRASLGAVFTLPVLCLSLHDVVKLLEQEGWRVFVTSPSTDRVYFEENFQGPIALVFGSEKDGLSASWFTGNFLKIRLPMLGEVDSLNLSTAVAAVAYEVVRQRWSVKNATVL